jgi:hypothetical protein
VNKVTIGLGVIMAIFCILIDGAGDETKQIAFAVHEELVL